MKNSHRVELQRQTWEALAELQVTLESELGPSPAIEKAIASAKHRISETWDRINQEEREARRKAVETRRRNQKAAEEAWAKAEAEAEREAQAREERRQAERPKREKERPNASDWLDDLFKTWREANAKRRASLKALGLAEGATTEEVRRAFRKASLSRHPDATGDAQAFRELQAHYEEALRHATA